MRHRGWLIYLLTGLLSAQYTYNAFFIQIYQPSGNLTTPDSLDIYICIRRSGTGNNDTLASSNFPFFYNTTALNFSGARILYRNKFHDNNYYAPLSYSVSGGQVNVTVQRKIGYAPPGDILDTLDTLMGLRVPLYACGQNLTSPLVWNSAPAAVLNSQLQSLKPRMTWRNDTLYLCPNFSITSAPSISTSVSPICPNRYISFTLGMSGLFLPDSFIVVVQQTAPSTSTPIIYPNIVTQSGGAYQFSLSFPSSGTYAVQVVGIYKKCLCSSPIASTSVIVSPEPAQLNIYGRDTIYAGGTAAYTLSQSPQTASWSMTNSGGSTTLSCTNAPSCSITFPSTPAPPRIDTISVSYTLSGTPCAKKAIKYVVVLPCPTNGGTITTTATNLCPGQRAELTLAGAPPGYDSLRWQIYDRSAWNVITTQGTGMTQPTYITPPLTAGSHQYRAILYYGGCRAISADITINVSGSLLVREFYGLQTPVCVGDTIQLYAEGPGVWYTPNGQGVFSSPNDPKGEYIPAPSDTGQIQICWVILPQDTNQCRDTRKDTLCLYATVTPSDASGDFSIPPGEDTICLGGRVALFGQIFSGAGGFWVADSASGGFYPDIFSQQAYYIPGAGDVGRWIRIAWVVGGNACGVAAYIDSVYVDAGTPVKILAPNAVCDNVALSLSAIPPMDSLLWFRGSVASVLANGGFTRSNPRFLTSGPSYDAGVLPAGTDTFCVYMRQGVCESVDEFPVRVASSPRAAFDASPRITTMNNPQITFTSQSQGANSYTWDFGDLNRITVDSTQTVVEHAYAAPGTYSVVLYVQNRLGCSDFYVCTDCIQILPRRVYLPNAFSPNGDGKNDSFRILPLEERFRFTRLEVFDRWGQIVFSGDDIAEWKGEGRDGRPLDAGSYSYRAIILIPDEGLFTYTGVVHIVR
ncbi:MAG: gliding motility-associated C-terminal domain-containing protein [Bacteroidia bacterium]|nr:gliding motility-associated C-terminal domain-containing protein [Bacteroidia bacterium]